MAAIVMRSGVPPCIRGGLRTGISATREFSFETDIEDFVKIKNLRDTLLHGELVDEKTLPVPEPLSLLKKYIRCHAPDRQETVLASR